MSSNTAAVAEDGTREKKVTVVHCWSAPRSRSTALLYSFEAREYTVALDEPLYTEWLKAQSRKEKNKIRSSRHSNSNASAVSRPYMQHMVEGTIPPEATNPQQWEREQRPFSQRLQTAIASLLATTCDDDDAATGTKDCVVFCKHMAKFAPHYDFAGEQQQLRLDTDEVGAGIAEVHHRHVLLLRDPVAVLSSWGAARTVHGSQGCLDLQEVGLIDLFSIFSILTSLQKEKPPVVIDSDELVIDPMETLQSLCADLGIDYQDSMMTWPNGPHECDGPWADWWYADVHQSTGWKKRDDFATHSSKYRTLHPQCLPALRASYPAYVYLQSLTRRHQKRGPPPERIYEDPRNEHVLVWIGAPGRGHIVPRSSACISPWDSSVQGGDGAWEGLRVYRGKILSLEKHLRRLFKSAKALGYENVHSREEVIEAIFRVLAANGMRDGAHMRLTLTRGEKCTSSMNPKFNVYGTTLIILAEWKPTEGATTYDNSKGISLITASQRRNRPDTVDSKIHHNNMINNILPKMQANLAGVADAIMLDTEGYVSETNATNIFMVDAGVLVTPHADHCLPGITRATVLELADELAIPKEVRRVSLAEFHSADEVFTTGTMGELTPVTHIDGRVIGDGQRGPVTARLQETYQSLPERHGWATALPIFTDN